MDEVGEQELLVERVAALDLGKAVLQACVRVPHPSRPGRRMQELRSFATTTSALLEMAGWFHRWGVTRVVMESTSSYWKGAYYVLEADGFDCWLVNARDVTNVPGRPKTDLLTEPLGITAAQSLDRHRGWGRIGDLRALAVVDRSTDLEPAMAGTAHSP
jgi:hypothetical protein